MLNINLHPFPVLATERLVLRQMNEMDAGELFALRSNKNTMEFLDRPLAESNEDALLLIRKINQSLANNDGITWAVTLKNNPALIGTIGFWRIMKEHYRAEIGYMLKEEFQKKGIMQEAVLATLHYGFYVMKLHSVEANVNPFNIASIKLLEKNNFIREAYFKENYYYKEKFLDSAVYSLITPVK